MTTSSNDPIRLDILAKLPWCFLSATLIAILAGLIPLQDHELWWHLTIGRLIDKHGAVPSSNHLLYTSAADAPSLFPSWWGQWLLFKIHQSLGIEGILTLRNLIIAFTTGLMTWCCLTLSQNWRSFIMGALCGVSLLFGVTASPLMFVVPLVGLIFCALVYGRTRSIISLLVLGVVTSLIWANVDAFFFLPALLLCSMAIIPGDHKRGMFLAGGIVCLLVTLGNPRGFALWYHLADILPGYPGHPDLAGWSSILASRAELMASSLFIALSALLASFLAYKKTPENTAVFILPTAILMAILGAIVSRYMWLFLLCCALPLATLFSTQHAEESWQTTGSWFKHGVVALLLLGMPWAFQPSLVPHAGFALSLSPYPLRSVQPHRAVVRADVPLTAARLLAQSQTPPRTYTQTRWAGLLMFFMLEKKEHRQIMYADPRAEFMTSDFLRTRTLMETTDIWRGIFQQYGMRAALLNKTAQQDMIKRLETDPTWIDTHRDEHHILFLKISALPK